MVIWQMMFSQQIVDTTKIWSIMEEYCQPWGTVYSTAYYKFRGDTLIEGNTYKNVWISNDEFHDNWDFFGAFIREVDNKVYYRNYSGDEGLIYDFNIEPGDSVVIDNPRGPGSMPLLFAGIDSVETNNGLRARWELTNDNYEISEYWIEGVGSKAGVINSSTGLFGSLCGLYYLLCESEDGETVYVNPEYNQCWMLTTGINEENNDKKIIVSVTDSNLEIVMPVNDVKTIFVSDISGNILYREVVNDKSISFPLSFFSNGIYLVTVKTSSYIQTRKIIIK